MVSVLLAVLLLDVDDPGGVDLVEVGVVLAVGVGLVGGVAAALAESYFGLSFLLLLLLLVVCIGDGVIVPVGGLLSRRSSWWSFHHGW